MAASHFRKKEMGGRWNILWTLLLLLVSTAGGNMLGKLIEMEEYQPESDPHAPYGTVWYNGSYLYIPAPPGKTPPCARGGMTFCDSIPTYPSNVIEDLLVQWKYDLSTVFSSENRDTLTSGIAVNTSSPAPPRKMTYPNRRPSSHYGQPPPVFQPIPGRSSPPVSFHGNTASSSDSSNQNVFSMQVGAAGFLYTIPANTGRVPTTRPVFTPQRTPPYNPENWGYSFAVKRQKRQSSSGGQLCPTTGQFVTPKAGLNNRGEWRYVINMGDSEEQYTQLVRAERCISSTCSGLCTLPAGMRATCEQQYVQKKMVGLDPSGSQVYTDLYWIPHCCVCQIR